MPGARLRGARHGAGEDARAAAYVEAARDGRVLWGVGIDSNILTSSLYASSAPSTAPDQVMGALIMKGFGNVAGMKLAVIAGDGIGPEVVAEGLRVLDSVLSSRREGRARSSTTWVRRAGTAPARRCPTACWTSSARPTRSCSVRSATRACRAGARAGTAAAAALRARPPRESAAGTALPGGGAPLAGEPDDRLRRRPRRHRGSVRGRRRRAARGTPHEIATEDSLNTALRRRAGRARRVRPGAGGARKKLTLVHKTNVLVTPGGCGSGPCTRSPPNTPR